MTVRVECDLEGLTANWVEIQDAGWARQDTVDMFALPDDDAVIAFLREKGKLLACHLELVNGQVIDTPDGVTESALMQADEALISFLGRTGWYAIGKRRALGNVSARLSSPVNGQS